MAHMSLARRAQILEQKVESLRELPARMSAVESQIVQLREEVRSGFSAIGDLRLEVRALQYETVARFEAQDDRIARLFDDLSRQMRVLHEDTLERIARLDESRR